MVVFGGSSLFWLSAVCCLHCDHSVCGSLLSPICPLGPLLWGSLQNSGPAVPSPLGPW